MSHRRVVASLLVLCLSGCLEEKQTVTLEPDGKGTLRVERTLGAQMSEMLLAGESDEAAAARRVAAQQLGQLGGIAAWTDVEATITDDKRVRILATGWFEDLARVETEKQGSKVAMFRVDRQGDAMTIRVRQDEGSGADQRSFFDREPQELEMMKGMIGSMATGMLQGLSSDVVLSIPGATTELGGWTSQQAGDRPTVGLHMDAQRVVHVLELMLATGEELRPKVTSGEMTKEAADLELQRRMASEVEARVVFTPDATKATPDFAAKLAAAKAAWEASPWKADVERAREGAMTFGRQQGEPPPEGLTRTTPDALEPNDSAEAATPIKEATTLRDLLLEEGGEDWFRIDLPKGKELTVTARFDGTSGDIDMELLDAEGRTLRTSSTMNNLERLRVAAREARTVLVRLHGGRNAYHLEVALVDYVPGDAFEPNDSREEAATIQAGAFEGLAANGEDWYRLDAPAGKLVDITIRFSSSEGDLDLFVDSASGGGSPLSEARGESVSERVRCFAPDGPLLVRVSGGAQDPVKYSMTIAVLEPPAKDKLEPNDSLGAARVLAPGRHTDLVLEGDDWYRFDLRDRKELRIAVRKTDDSLPGDVGLTLFVPGARRGEEVELSSARSAFTDEAVLTIARPRAGPVFVRVTGGVVPYALEVTAADYRAEDALEPNDYRLDARSIRAGKLEGLQCGGDDWYRVELKAGEALSAAARFVHADGDLDLELQDGQGNFLGSSGGSSDEELVDLAPDAAPRVVCIHVYPTDRSKRTPYALEVTVTKKP